MDELIKQVKLLAEGVRKQAEKITQVDKHHNRRYDEIDRRVERLERGNGSSGGSGS